MQDQSHLKLCKLKNTKTITPVAKFISIICKVTKNDYFRIDEKERISFKRDERC
jgi:hypothetical protein